MGLRFLELCLKNRIWVILATLVVIVGLANGAKNLAISNDYRDFFSDDNPQLLAFENLQDTYDKSDNVMILLTPKDGKVFSPQMLESIQWLTEEAWQTPFSTRVDSITNFQHTRAFEDDLEVSNLVDDPNLSPAELEAIKNIAVSEPLLLDRLINREASVTGINITVQLPGKSLDEVPQVAIFARELAERMEAKFPNVETRLTGIVMMNNAFSEAAQADAMALTPAMFGVVIVALVILLRSISLTFVTVMCFAMSAAAAMGMAGWAGYKLEPITISAPTIILTMAVADAVHLLSTYIVGLRQGKEKYDAMLESLRVNLMPLFITSATTALGFLSMNFSEVPPLNHLGNMVAFGVMIAFLLTITFVPAVAISLPGRFKQSENTENPMLAGLADFVVANRKPLMFGMLAVSILFIAMVPKNQINDEFVNYFDDSVEFKQDTVYAAKHLVGPYTLEFSVESQEDGGISNPAYLKKLDAFIDHLHSYVYTSHVFTLTDTFKRLNKNMHGDDESWYKLPDNQELAAQYLLLYEMSLPYGLDLNNQIDVGKTATRITMSTINMSTQQVLQLERDIRSWLDANASELKVDISSPNVIFAHTGVRNAKSLVFGATIALFFISLIMIVALRSVNIGLISLIPNLVPAGIAFGVWALIDGMVGMSVSIVAGMTLGIVVDDSVHFLSKYLRARRENGYGPEEAVRYAFTHVGNALVITTIVLVAGFLVLTLSTFKMNSDMGLVTAITIVAALVVDFLLLPPLLIMFDKSKTKSKVTNDEQSAKFQNTAQEGV